MHVAEFKEGECRILFAKPGPHVKTDSEGKFELVVDREYLEELGNRFCLEAAMPGQFAPIWGVVEIEKDESGRHKVQVEGLLTTLTQTADGVLMAFTVEDKPLVFRVPETESVIDLGDVYVPGEIIDRT